MRRLNIASVAVFVVLGLAVSALLARVWSADGAESAAVTALVRAEARGDQRSTVDLLTGCRQSSACNARVGQDLIALRQPGTVSILQIKPSAGFSLGSSSGNARVAWKASNPLPIVQCVRVRRAGNALSGIRIELLGLSGRIKSDAECPRRF